MNMTQRIGIQSTRHAVNWSPANVENYYVQRMLYTRIHNHQTPNLILTLTVLLNSEFVACDKFGELTGTWCISC